MSRRAATQDAASGGAVIVPFRTRSMADDQTTPEWRPMLPPQLFTPEVGVDGIAVYGTLCLYVDRQTGECWPSQKTIADRIGVSRESVNRAIKRLEMLGLVFVEHRAHEGKSNLYTLPDQRGRVSAQRTPLSSGATPLPLGSTPLSPESTPGVTQDDTGCDSDRHEPDISEPEITEPETGETPLTPQAPAPTPNPAVVKPARPKARGTAVPVDFVVTEELREFGEELGFTSAELAAETAKFIDHFRGTGGLKVDWVATWRNWMRRSGEERRTRPPRKTTTPAVRGPSRAEQTRARAAALREQGL